VIGIGAKSIDFLSKNRIRIQGKTAVVLPPQEGLDLCLDKNALIEFARSIGVITPKSIYVDNLEDLKLKASDFQYPAILKSAGEIGKNFETLYFESSKSVIDFLEKNKIEISSGALLQSRIYGVGEAFFGIYDNGQLVDFFMHQRVRENPISGGPSSKAKSISKEDLYEQGKSILDQLNWHGPAMVEFKRGLDNNLYLMEVNPKFWGSLDLAIESGINFPLILTAIALPEKVALVKSRHLEKTFQWPFDGDISVGLRNPRLLPSVLADLINPKIKKNIYLNDLMPTIQNLVNSAFLNVGKVPGLKSFRSLIYKLNNNGIYLGFLRWFSEEFGIPLPKYSKLTANLYVGGRVSRLGLILLRVRGVTELVNLQEESPTRPASLSPNHYLSIPVKDLCALSEDEYIAGVQFIEQKLREQKKIYVHCREGIGRAPSLIAAHLISSGLSTDDAIKLIRQIRPFVALTDLQYNSLQIFHRKIRAQKSL